MAKVLITPIRTSGVEPFELTGKLTKQYFDDGGWVYYIGGASYPEAIVTILEESPK